MSSTETTIRRAGIYGLLARAFAYPDDRTIEVVRRESQSLTAALRGYDSDKSYHEAAVEFTEITADMTDDKLKSLHNELFVGRRQCQLDESEYDEAIFNRYQRLADIAGFYRAFGFNVSKGANQRADFIGTELEFMQVLLLKRAYAEEQEWKEEARTCLSAESTFIREHLEWWVTLMCENLRGDETCPFHTSLGNFLDHFIRTETLRYPQPD